jgi:hypothetical protein
MPDDATAAAISDPSTIEAGISNSTYDLVVLLQQALEDCARYQHFARDARDDGDDELADYFEELAVNDHGVAARARQLLARRL